MKEQVQALLEALSQSGCDGVRARMPALVAAIAAPLDAKLTRTVLDELRAHRCFAAMVTFASEAAKIADGNLQIYVKRQLAQALIERGNLDRALTLLEALEPGLDKTATPKERNEVAGLRGRVLKQQFVGAVEGGSPGQRELREALEAYQRGFDLGVDPGWHGANIVALRARAERDRLDVGGESAEVWARRVLERLEEKAQASWSAWDYAAAGEVCLALENEWDRVATSFANYWNTPGLDAFSLEGTARNLAEIWQFSHDGPDERRRSLMLAFEARRLTSPRAADSFSAAQLHALTGRLQAGSGKAEAMFGAGSAIPIDRLLRLLGYARSVCRIGDLSNTDKAGTGFLVSGPAMGAPDHEVCLLTNHHVLHGPELSQELLGTDNYKGSILVENAEANFHYWEGAPQLKKIKIGKMLRWSPRPELDFALVTLAEKLPATLALPFSPLEKPLGSPNVTDPKQRAKVFVIGHPKGGEISFSLSDNEVVDHELDGNPHPEPRRIHYRAATAPGSSGSPVLHHQTLDVVGLHRSGGVKPLREKWPKAREDEVYEANEAVAIRSLV